MVRFKWSTSLLAFLEAGPRSLTSCPPLSGDVACFGGGKGRSPCDDRLQQSGVLADDDDDEALELFLAQSSKRRAVELLAEMKDDWKRLGYVVEIVPGPPLTLAGSPFEASPRAARTLGQRGLVLLGLGSKAGIGVGEG